MTVNPDPDRYRPIEQPDFVRVLLLLSAFEAHAAESDEPMWETLERTHDHRDAPPEWRGDGTGKEFLAREITHAHLVIESLAWHDGRIPRTIHAIPRPCANPDCSNLTSAWGICDDCEWLKFVEEHLNQPPESP